LDFNKSPLGVPIAIGIGVYPRKETFSKAQSLGKKEKNHVYNQYFKV
jgi:hypothetical protein